MDEIKVTDEGTGKSGNMTEISSAAAAVEAMKASQNQAVVNASDSKDEASQETSEVPAGYVKTSDKWKGMLADLQKEVEDELKKADETVTELLESEKKKAADAVKKELTEKLETLEKEKNAEIERLTKENEELKKDFDAKKDEVRAEVEKEAAEKQEAEIASLKAQYEQQLAGIQNTNHDKLQAMRKEMDGYKEQIETLMLHIDDPFVLQEIQNPAKAPGQAESQGAAEEK